MSVTASWGLLCIPLYRDIERIKPQTPSLIGRYHGFGNCMGDASGGTYGFSFAFNQIKGLFGNYAMFDVAFINLFMGIGGAALSLVTWTIEPYERSTHPTFGLQLKYQAAWGINMTTLDSPLVPTNYKFRFSDYDSSPTQFNINATANQNGINCYCSLGGYIYDERYL